ncbi:hypothetical protein [Heyndrickxia sporothermodurans]
MNPAQVDESAGCGKIRMDETCPSERIRWMREDEDGKSKWTNPPDAGR